jgi:hypothetical protein
MGELARRQMVDIDGGPIPKGRVSKRLMLAIRKIEEEGMSITAAAEASGYQPHSLMQALKKPHVRTVRADVKRAWRESEAPKAWNRIVKLAKDGQSEKVRLEADKTILNALGELETEGPGSAPSTLIQLIRNETHVHASHPLTQRLPGVVEAQDYQDADFTPLDPKRGLTPSEDT